jgi:hypothetical protein
MESLHPVRGARELPHGFELIVKSDEFAPVTLTAVMFSVADESILVRRIVWAELVLPTATPPKSTCAG